MGDGAVNQGVFHESLNLASLFNLPVVYIIENNGYSMGTSLERSSAYTDSLGKRAEAYKIEWDTVQGHLIYEVRAKVNEAIQRAHEQSRPTILEIITYRYRGHSIADANADKYRTKAEVKEYQEKKDPINVWRNLLIEDQILTEEEAKAMDKEARKEADASADFADKSPYPPTESIIDDVYWTHDNPDDHDNEGRIFFNDDWGPQA
jgi:pyruvate dehydrogenase E1 component alpha subunit